MLFPPQSHERLADFYSAADVVLVPSRSESFGLVALEAQACGTPVVGAAVGGLPPSAAAASWSRGTTPPIAPRPSSRPWRPRVRRLAGRGGRPRVAGVLVGRDDDRGPVGLPRAARGRRVIHGSGWSSVPSRSATTADRDWQNDPEVWWLMDYEGPFSLADIAESEERARKEGHPYVIEVDGTPVGPDRPQRVPASRPDLLALRPDRRAVGVGPRHGTDAEGLALVDEAFDAVRPPSRGALVHGRQRARDHVYEKCGFVVDGVYPSGRGRAVRGSTAS